MEASSGSPGAHINERMIADALIEAGLVTGRRLVGSDLRAWQQLWTYDEQPGMYGPPLRRKRNVRMSQVGLRKCIRPLLE